MSNDLISRAALLRKECCGRISGKDVREAPAVDAEPVRLRVEKSDIVDKIRWYRKRFYCPCGQLIRTESWDEKRCFGQETILKENVMPRYCPNCGARMDEE